MALPKRYTVTSALPYANGPLHLGHIAGVYLPADIYVRYLRSSGKDVLFICGSDEHGAAITLRAKKEGTTPQEIVDKYHHQIESTFKKFNVNFDIYDRTSSELHHETAQEYFKTLEEKGVFEKKVSQQYYDEKFNQFLADRYITGGCPKCDYDSAYGDQCEKCGSSLSPTELINPTSTLSGDVPILKETSHWYLPMQDHEDWLKTWIKEGELDGQKVHDPKEWKNHVTGQCMSWLEGGLHSRAMTRDLDWGVKVPVKGADGKVLYVWLDAPIGYISASKKWAQETGKDWQPYWKDEDSKLVHFIGKDNIVFHCIIFPILLKAHGDYILPKNVPANEFLNLEGDKFSTSRNWAVWLHEYLEEFPDKVDELRYVLCSILPENKDAEFTWKDYQSRINNELADVLGNLVNRAVVFSHKYFDGVVPAKGLLTEVDQQILDTIQNAPAIIASKIEAYRFKEALSEAMNLARAANKYLADTEPWKLIKTAPSRVDTITNIVLQVVANLGLLIEPILPNTSVKIKAMLSLDQENWSSAGNTDLVKEGSIVQKIPVLFTKVEDSFVEAQVEKLKAAQSETVSFEPEKEKIDFDSFTSLDIRVGTILSAEKVKKAKKLLKLEVDTGLDKRIIVSGIAEYFEPENIIGKKVSVLLNLEPRKIRGVESQGMILMAENSKGELSFIEPTEDTIHSGSTIR